MDGSIKRTALFTVHFLCLLAHVIAQNQCYACNYTISRSVNTTDGPEACYRPSFNPEAEGITKVNCTGECNYIVKETSDILQATRGCSLSSDPCKESTSTSRDNASFTSYCCTGPLCNDETITNKSAEPLGDDGCYTCKYVKGALGTDGSPGCSEPFDALAVGVVKIQCNSSCQYTVYETSHTFRATRGCSLLDSCIESTSTTHGGSFTRYCCSGPLCNDETITNKPAEQLGDDECYTCSYQKGNFWSAGSPGCYEPFDPSANGVVKTQCSSTCQLKLNESGGILTVTRDCHDDGFECDTSCVTVEGNSVCTYCCSPGTVCNKDVLNLLSFPLFLATIFLCFECFM